LFPPVVRQFYNYIIAVLLLSYQGGLIAIEIRLQTIADVCRASLELAWREAGRIVATLEGRPSE